MASSSKWLAGDTTYQQQLSNYNKSKTDYNSQYTRQKNITTRDYAEMLRSMNRQGTTDRVDQQNDFAGRGILKSGVFAKALGDYNTEFNSKVKNLQTGKSDEIGDLDLQRTNFLRQLTLESDAAKQDALRRRAAKLGI
jgi:16S rRNA G527 N7-methylase RsmG